VNASVCERVGTRTTPGTTVDVHVTNAGIAANPLRGDLHDRLRAAKLPLKSIEELHRAACARAPQPSAEGRIAALWQYGDGTATDVIREVPEERHG
jgi:citrate lyase subunit alpha/citrate CoA-transferase